MTFHMCWGKLAIEEMQSLLTIENNKFGQSAGTLFLFHRPLSHHQKILPRAAANQVRWLPIESAVPGKATMLYRY